MYNKAVIKTLPMFFLLYFANNFTMKEPDLIIEIKSGKKIAYYKKDITQKELLSNMTKIIVCNCLFIHMYKNKFARYSQEYNLVKLKNFTEQEYEITDKNNFIIEGEPYPQ